MAGVRLVPHVIPLPGSMGFDFTTLALVLLRGSFITEPAAMTLVNHQMMMVEIVVMLARDQLRHGGIH